MRKLMVVCILLLGVMLYGDVWTQTEWNDSLVVEKSNVNLVDGKYILSAPNESAYTEQSNLTTVSGAQEMGAFYKDDNGVPWIGSGNPAKVYFSLDGWFWTASPEVPLASTDTRVYGIACVDDTVLIVGGLRGTGSFICRSFDAFDYDTLVTWDDSVYIIGNCNVRDIVASGSRIFAVTGPENVLYSGANDGKVYISDNYGYDFTSVSFGGNAFYDIVKWGPDTLIVIGDTINSGYPQPMIAMTTDNGATWTTLVFSALGVDYFGFAGERIDDTTLLVSTYPDRIYAIINPFSASPIVEERDTANVISDPDTVASDIVVTSIHKADNGAVYMLMYSQNQSDGSIEYTKVLKTTDGGYTIEEIDSMDVIKAIKLGQDKRGFLYVTTTNSSSIGKTYFYGYVNSGYFVSQPVYFENPDYPNLLIYDTFYWDGDSTSNRFYSASVKVRTGSDETMSDATDWTSISDISSGTSFTDVPSVIDGQEYFQYMVEYSSLRAYITPVIDSLEVDYHTDSIYLTVTYPNGGELIVDSCYITWESNYTDLITIEFSKDAGVTWDTIASGIENTGSYLWVLDSTLRTDEGLVKISYTDHPAWYDESDNIFATSLSFVEKQDNDHFIKINPVASGLMIEGNGYYNIKVYDIAGREISDINIANNSDRVNLHKGVYFIRVSGDISFTKRIVIIQ